MFVLLGYNIESLCIGIPTFRDLRIVLLGYYSPWRWDHYVFWNVRQPVLNNESSYPRRNT